MVTATDRHATLAPISRDESYPLPIFMARAGLSLWAMRQARRNGLRVVTVGKRRYVTGTDWHDYLAMQR